MKPPDSIKMGFVRQWLAKAGADFMASQRLFQGGSAYALGAAFHAQQAAEKFIKALLVWHQVEFSKIHDIARLLDLLAPVEKELAHFLEEASLLTPYAAQHRYPGDLPEPTLSEAEKAVEIAQKVRDRVLERLPPEVRNDLNPG